MKRTFEQWSKNWEISKLHPVSLLFIILRILPLINITLVNTIYIIALFCAFLPLHSIHLFKILPQVYLSILLWMAVWIFPLCYINATTNIFVRFPVSYIISSLCGV